VQKEGIWQVDEDCTGMLIILATRALLLSFGDQFIKTAVNKYCKSKIPKSVNFQTSYYMET
jgi:hypothetical protein